MKINVMWLITICIFLITITNVFLYAEESAVDEVKREMTLADAVETAVRLNPLVEETRLEWLIATRNVNAEWGQFEPNIVGYYSLQDFNHRNNIKETIEQLGNTEYFEDTEEYALGIEGKTPTGSTYNIGYTLNKKKSTYASDHEYNTYIGITLEQPLLRGATRGAPRAGINVANRERIIAFHKYRKQLMETITQVEAAYWNLAFAQELYQIHLDSVDIAKKLVKDAEERVKTGKMSQLEFTEAEAGLALREIALAESEQNIMSAMTELRLLVADYRLNEDRELIAMDSLFSVEEPSGLEKMEIMETIVSMHPDYLIRKNEVERESIALNYYKDQCLPVLNVIGNYNLTGMGGSFEDSIHMTFDQTNPSWSLKLELQVPLFGSISRNNQREAAQLKKHISEKNFEATEYEVVNAITMLLQHIETLSKRRENMKKVVGVKQRLLDVELSRLEAGYSNSRLVYEAEEELFDARQNEMDTIVRYKLAVSRLAMVCGTSLSDKNLEKRENGKFFLEERLVKKTGK
ncbi:MAG: TolC family protein [Spirochaetales bacterium]|nr:TolC family protein [Spirochaetales bacterium]